MNTNNYYETEKVNRWKKTVKTMREQEEEEEQVRNEEKKRTDLFV